MILSPALWLRCCCYRLRGAEGPWANPPWPNDALTASACLDQQRSTAKGHLDTRHYRIAVSALGDFPDRRLGTGVRMADIYRADPWSRREQEWSQGIAMRVSLEIPEDLGPRIAADPGELPRAALEGLALEAIRAGKLTVSQARRLLGIASRYEMDGFLKAHGVFLDLTLEDVRRDSEVARALSG